MLLTSRQAQLLLVLLGKRGSVVRTGEWTALDANRIVSDLEKLADEEGG